MLERPYAYYAPNFSNTTRLLFTTSKCRFFYTKGSVSNFSASEAGGRYKSVVCKETINFDWSVNQPIVGEGRKTTGIEHS